MTFHLFSQHNKYLDLRVSREIFSEKIYRMKVYQGICTSEILNNKVIELP